MAGLTLAGSSPRLTRYSWLVFAIVEILVVASGLVLAGDVWRFQQA